MRDREDQLVRLLLQEALTGLSGLLSRHCLCITFANQDIRHTPIPSSASQREICPCAIVRAFIDDVSAAITTRITSPNSEIVFGNNKASIHSLKQVNHFILSVVNISICSILKAQVPLCFGGVLNVETSIPFEGAYQWELKLKR